MLLLLLLFFFFFQWCELPKIGGHLVYCLSNLNENSPFSAVIWQHFWDARENLKFYVEFFKNRGHWVWTVVKNGVSGCKICVKKVVIIQASDISRHMGVPPPGHLSLHIPTMPSQNQKFRWYPSIVTNWSTNPVMTCTVCCVWEENNTGNGNSSLAPIRIRIMCRLFTLKQ